jgi:hypothetical protein
MELKTSSKRRFFLEVDKGLKDYFDGLKECSIQYESTATIRQKMMVYDSDYSEIHIVDTTTSPTFSKLVKKHMEEKNITTKDIYKNSLIDRKLFSSLNVNDNYSPSKETAIMYCFALKLNLDESMELLNSAGYTLYEYSNFDIIVKYFLNNSLYNIDRLNDALYFYTKKCIGYR